MKPSALMYIAVILVIVFLFWYTGFYNSLVLKTTRPIDIPPNTTVVYLGLEFISDESHQPLTNMRTYSQRINEDGVLAALQGNIALARTSPLIFSEKAAAFIWVLSSEPLSDPMPDWNSYPAGANVRTLYTHSLLIWGPSTTESINVNLNIDVSAGEYLAVIIDVVDGCDAVSLVNAYVA
jgi:hypothetical protein